MGIIGTALGEAAGMTMNQVGTAMIAADIRREENEGRWAVERERIAKDIQLRREEIAQRKHEAEMRWGDDGDGSGSGSGKGGKGGVSAIIAKIVGAKPELYGMNAELPGKDKFTTTTEGAIDETGVGPGPKIETYDEAGHTKAKQGIVESNIKNLNRVFQPDKYDDLEKGNAQSMLNDLLAQAKAETDPKRREERVQDLNKIAIAAGAKDRFEVKDGTVIDVATGATRTTEVGKSEIKKNEGAANESNADARKAGKTTDTSGMSKTELIQYGTNLRAQLGSAERRIKAAETVFKDMSKNDKDYQTKKDELDALRKEFKDVNSEISAVNARLKLKDDAMPAAEKPKTDKPKVDAKQPPKISEVTGAPAGAKIGIHDSKGWQVLDAKGKVIGYVGN